VYLQPLWGCTYTEGLEPRPRVAGERLDILSLWPWEGVYTLQLWTITAVPASEVKLQCARISASYVRRQSVEVNVSPQHHHRP